VKRMGGGDWAEKWRNSEEWLPSRLVPIQLYPAPEERTATDLLSLLSLQREIKHPNEEAFAKPDDVNAEAVKDYPTSFPFQLNIIIGRTFKAFWRMLELRMYSTPQPVSLRRPFPFSALSCADVSIPSSAAYPSPSSPRSRSSISATRSRSFRTGSLPSSSSPSSWPSSSLRSSQRIMSRAGYLQPRSASRISPRLKDLPLTSLSFLLLAGLLLPGCTLPTCSRSLS
jgi:hypothetical protein